MRKSTDIPITVDTGFYILAAFMLLLLPIKWIAAWVCAGIVHELCHYGALRLCRADVLGLHITAGGAVMDADIGGIKACFASLAGPVGGLLLTLLGKQMPRLAVCALIQSVYNLLPLYPLDGGRAIREMLSCIVGDIRAKRISRGIGTVFLTGSACLALYLWLRLSLGCLPLLLVGFLAFKTSFIKFPCKGRRFGLQYNVNKNE